MITNQLSAQLFFLLTSATLLCRGFEDMMPHALNDWEHKESLTNGGSTSFFEILEPEELRYTYALTASQISPAFNSTSPSGQTTYLVLSDPPCGCGPITNQVADKVVLIQRGECSFVSKAIRAQQAGASGAIITDNDDKNDQLTISMVDDTTNRKISIPVAFLLGMNGYYIRTVLERNGLDQAVIQIPINITQKAIVEINQPPWLVW